MLTTVLCRRPADYSDGRSARSGSTPFRPCRGRFHVPFRVRRSFHPLTGGVERPKRARRNAYKVRELNSKVTFPNPFPETFPTHRVGNVSGNGSPRASRKADARRPAVALRRRVLVHRARRPVLAVGGTPRAPAASGDLLRGRGAEQRASSHAELGRPTAALIIYRGAAAGVRPRILRAEC